MTEETTKEISSQVEHVVSAETEIAFEAERLERRREQKRRYWNETFQKKKRRIHGTLDAPVYRELEVRAKLENRSPWQQLLAESEAYRAGHFLPSEIVENQLQSLDVQCRKIGTNINQIAKLSNHRRRVWGGGSELKELRLLLDELKMVIATLWHHRKSLADEVEKEDEARE